MTIIQEIHAWSKQLTAWQQDAIARLYASRILTPQDLEDLYALVKSEVGIPDEDQREPSKLQDTEVAPQANPTRLVQIVAVKDLINVNALVQGGRLPISPTGITAIYGENGAGKHCRHKVMRKIRPSMNMNNRQPLRIRHRHADLAAPLFDKTLRRGLRPNARLLPAPSCIGVQLLDFNSDT